MKTISKKFNISKVLIFFSAILLFVSSLLLTQNQKQVYADVKHDQGYFRTVKDFDTVYNLDTIADGSQNIVSAFGYAGNRGANIVNKDYTSKSSASEFIFVADSCTDTSPTNSLVYQVIYLPDNYIYPAKNGVISATLSYNIGSPDYKQFWSSKYDTTPDENQITLASLTSRDFSAATSMSISDFAVDGENYAKDSVTSRTIISRTLNLPANKLTTNTLGLFFQSMYKGGGNNSMTMNSPKLTLHCSDNSAPEISFSKTRDGEYANKRTITVTVKDSGGIKEVTLNNGTFIADRTIINETRSEATYVFEVSENGEYEVSATDYFGRTSTLQHIEDKIDKVAPEIIVINNLQSLYYTKQITIEAAFAYMGPSDEYFVYTLDGTEPNQQSPSLVSGENTITVAENGEQTLKVLSFDSAGNYNEVQEFSFYVDDNYYSVNVDCSEGVNVSQDGENLRYAEEYTFEYS
ncbi:MAG: chitobiase/beta-hexosaminidase C-terminal domain-containing protein, partial [Clostridia bacterium]|nr:chitobiase/beta-hexosaminidase C-terminal domain-containing protein [Clostridia bacterium]